PSIRGVWVHGQPPDGAVPRFTLALDGLGDAGGEILRDLLLRLVVPRTDRLVDGVLYLREGTGPAERRGEHGVRRDDLLHAGLGEFPLDPGDELIGGHGVQFHALAD